MSVNQQYNKTITFKPSEPTNDDFDICYLTYNGKLTKIVDYLAMARPILAVGPVDVASIAHLKKNNAALVASTEKEVLDAVFQLVNDYSILNRMSIAAFECGRLHHNKNICLPYRPTPLVQMTYLRRRLSPYQTMGSKFSFLNKEMKT